MEDGSRGIDRQAIVNGAEDGVHAHILHAKVAGAARELTAVVAGTTREVLASPENGDVRGVTDHLPRSGRAKDGHDRRSNETRKVHRPRVVGDDEARPRQHVERLRN